MIGNDFVGLCKDVEAGHVEGFDKFNQFILNVLAANFESTDCMRWETAKIKLVGQSIMEMYADYIDEYNKSKRDAK